MPSHRTDEEDKPCRACSDFKTWSKLQNKAAFKSPNKSVRLCFVIDKIYQSVEFKLFASFLLNFIINNEFVNKRSYWNNSYNYFSNNGILREKYSLRKLSFKLVIQSYCIIHYLFFFFPNLDIHKSKRLSTRQR